MCYRDNSNAHYLHKNRRLVLNFDYDKIWQADKGWNETTEYGPACRHRRRIIKKMVDIICHTTHGSRVLDLGCGDGTLLKELEKKGYDLSGYDCSQTAIDIARIKCGNATLTVCDLNNAKIEGRYDVIIMQEVLEHLENDVGLIKHCAERSPWVIITVPGDPLDKPDKTCGHYRNYSPDALRKLLDDGGYEVVSCWRWGWPWHSLVQWALHKNGDASSKVAGEYGPAKKVVSKLLYWLYFANVSNIGNQLVAVANKK